MFPLSNAPNVSTRLSQSFSRLAVTELLRYRQTNREPLPADVWEFLTNCTYTTDEYARAKGIEPVQPFPRDPYLEYVTRQWQAADRLRIEKSRDMVMSWWGTAVHLHAALTIPGIYLGYASKKLLDANLFLESRFLCIYRRIPSRYAVPLATHNKSDGMLTIEHANGLKSYVVGVPQGTEQARQYKFLFYWWDEMGAAEKQETTWTAIRPALAVGGKFTTTCSAKGKNNLFYQFGYENVTGGDSAERAPLEVIKQRVRDLTTKNE